MKRPDLWTPEKYYAASSLLEASPVTDDDGHRTWLRSRRWVPIVWQFPLLVYTVILFALYAVCLLVPYAFVDDYNLLADVLRGPSNRAAFVTMALDGRPLYSLLATLSFSLMRNINDLRYLRVIAIGGLALLAWLLYRFLTQNGMDRRVAFLASLLICVMPPFQVYVAWATCAFFPLAAVLAGTSQFILNRAMQKQARRQLLALWAAAAIVLLAGIMIYQPAAMMFWVFAAVAFFVSDRSFAYIVKYGVMSTITMGVAFALDYVWIQIAPPLLIGYDINFNRTQLVQYPRIKLLWFLHEPLLEALNLAKLLPSVRLAVLVAAFVCTGLLLYFHGSATSRLGTLAIALALVPACYAPNLIVAEDWATYRTQVAMTSLIVFYVVLALLGVARWGGIAARNWNRWDGQQAALLLLTGLTLICAVFAVRNVTRDWVISNHDEYSVLESLLRQQPLGQSTTVYAIECSRLDSTAQVMRYDEFGNPTCMTDWALPDMVYVALKDVDPARAAMTVQLLPLSAADKLPASVPPGSAVVNMHLLRFYRAQEPVYIPFE